MEMHFRVKEKFRRQTKKGTDGQADRQDDVRQTAQADRQNQKQQQQQQNKALYFVANATSRKTFFFCEQPDK